MERLSFITTQFKFLLPFTGCIKVLDKMLACLILFTILRSKRNKNSLVVSFRVGFSPDNRHKDSHTDLTDILNWESSSVG